MIVHVKTVESRASKQRIPRRATPRSSARALRTEVKEDSWWRRVLGRTRARSGFLLFCGLCRPHYLNSRRRCDKGTKKKSTLATPRGPSPALSLLLPALSSAKGQCLTHLEGLEKLARRPVQQRFPLLDWKRGDGGGGASKNEEKASLLTNEDARDRAQHFPLRYPPPSLHVRIRDAQCAT